ncbi:hypothetical protein CCR75_007062 [Bremia lactucae]|uniref:Phospholipid-transporting ATPase n=1 Tax=Bremia lactucae TaxID=4779 RepID=A0A976FPY5_BRELC|nr:hypothetical protein CCR75_007062 [Bremia lactucae]
MDGQASDAEPPPSLQAQYHRLQPSPNSADTSSERTAFNPSKYFHRNQTVEVLSRHPAGASGLLIDRLNSDLFRTLTSSQLLNVRQRLLNDGASSRTELLTRLGTASTPTTASNAGYFRRFHRNLPRPLRFRQNTRSTTRYIDPANAASLRSRVRARQEQEQARNEGFDDEPSPHSGARDMTDFEKEMTSIQNGTNAGMNASPKASHKVLDRMSSLMSTDSQGISGGARTQYKIVKINDGHNAPKREPLDGDGDESDEYFFVSNEVTTSQYTWWSFVPVFLYLTFQKTANLYFLLIGIFQMIPSVSPTNGVPLQFMPLAFVIIIDGLFAGYEDHKRHQADDFANSAITRVFNRQLREFEEVEWRELKVGDFVKVANHEILPADVMILAVIPAEGARSGGNMGLCYVETKNLDGETNLKLREAPSLTRNMFMNEDEAGYIVQGYVESELPNGDINTYSGTLYLEENPLGGAAEGVPLSLKNMLMRGSKLRNTSFAYGLVVNTGVDTKIMMSSGDEFPVKASSIAEMTNRQIIIVVVILMIMSLIGAIGDRIWMGGLVIPQYLELEDYDDSVIEVFIYFITTLASMVPITLYVAITLVKALQGYFMESDLDMYDEESSTPMKVRNMQLNEQLGEISHIFSDKTGTLTCNKMEFRKCSIGGRSYGKGTTAIGLAARMRNDFKGYMALEDDLGDETADIPLMGEVSVPNVNFKDPSMWCDLKNQSHPQSGKIEEFMTLLALCHGVLIERHDPTEEDASPAIEYSASSPDELALVCGAKFFGYEFIEREPGSVSIRKPDGVVDQYDILEVFEFDSNRKRMSVIVQRRKRDDELRQMSESDEDDVLLLTKGADSMLFPRLAPMSENNQRIREVTEKHLEAFAQDGLRTLVVCAKKIRPEDWEQFHAQYRLVSSDLSVVEAKSRGEPNAINKIEDQVESNLEILGATAIEDRLQDGVPESMEALAKAGICIWVLTGDMEETAINIGYACRLLNNDMQRHVINEAKYRTKGSILRKLDKIFHSIYDAKENSVESSLAATPSDSSLLLGQAEHALVIDGASLTKILEDPLFNLHLLRVALLCKVVVACRVSPQQKAQLVELVKLNVPESHTLSIGDGANDVPMIQSAHIGVGISGQEGLQAVNSSDYALAQFRFLSNLILVHGRWNYNRVTALVVYTFYTNIAYNTSMFWYTLWPTAYSGTMIYSALIQQGFNVIFTALPILIYSAYDKDIPKNTVLEYPALYHAELRKSSFFSHLMFWKWVFLGIIDSVGVYFATLAAGWNIERGGNTVEYLSLGTLGWTILCILMNARFCLLANSWDVLTCSSMVVTVVSIYLAQYVVDQINWSFDTDSLPWQYGRAQFWFGQLIAVAGILLKDILYEGYRRRFNPDYIDLVTESLTDKASMSREELKNFQPPQANYLNPELAGMMDFQDRRVHESTPVRYAAPGRSKLYTGFAFDQPANIINWILTGTNNSGGQNSRKSINANMRHAILNSDDPVFFENQRYQPFCGYGSSFPGYLLPTDRKRWSDRSGKVSAQAIPLAGLELDLEVPGCDAEGWVYEKDFAFFPSTIENEEDEIEDEDDFQISDSRRSSIGAFRMSRKKSKKKKGKKMRPHHGLVRRREWKLSSEYKAQTSEDARRCRESNESRSSVVDDPDEHRRQSTTQSPMQSSG